MATIAPVNFANVVVSCRFDGVNGSAAFVDESTHKRKGVGYNLAQQTDNRSRYQSTSLLCSAPSYVGFAADLLFDPASSTTWTLQATAYRTEIGADTTIASTIKQNQITGTWYGWRLMIVGYEPGPTGYGPVVFELYEDTNSPTLTLSAPSPWLNNSWGDVLVQRSGSTWSLFFEGARVAMASYSTVVSARAGMLYVAATQLAIGNPDGQDHMRGNIEQFRITAEALATGTSYDIGPLSPSLATELQRYLSSQRTGVAGIDCLELSHPDWPDVYRVTTMPGGCVTPDSKTWIYVPMAVKPPATSDDLSWRTGVTLQDLNEDGVSNGLIGAVSELVDLIPADSEVAVSCTAYGYLLMDDNTITGPTAGPYALTVTELTFTEQGVTFTAEPEQTNKLPCGERVTLTRFPQARQFTS